MSLSPDIRLQINHIKVTYSIDLDCNEVSMIHVTIYKPDQDSYCSVFTKDNLLRYWDLVSDEQSLHS